MACGMTGDPADRLIWFNISIISDGRVSLIKSRGAYLAAATGLFLSLTAAACTTAPTTGPARTTAIIPGQALIVAGNPGYAGNAAPESIARYAYLRGSSCPQAKAGTGTTLTLKAQWAYGPETIRLDRISGAFDESRGSLAMPFMIFVLSPVGSTALSSTQRRWLTTQVDGNAITGYHSTGWTLTNLAWRTAIDPDPDLSLQLWAMSSSGANQGTEYCVAATDLALTARHH
jgi:hypothetical protein